MRDHSQDEQALIRIQHDWAEPRVKGRGSYTQRVEMDDCAIVWPDSKIVNRRADLQMMTGAVVFSEFKISDLQVRIYGESRIVVGQGKITAQKGRQNLLSGNCLD